MGAGEARKLGGRTQNGASPASPDGDTDALYRETFERAPVGLAHIDLEGRWLRFNQFVEIYQDNYLIGPRVPIHQFGRVTPYGKFLFGIGKMNFEYSATSCRCTNLVYGGGADVQLTKRISWRAVDFEYQQWPTWYALQNGQLHPYGFSTGIGYKIF